MQTIGTVVQACTREITCEKCGSRYAYAMIRRASAVAGDVGAQGREAALSRASQHAQAMLATENDPVRCPACGHFQQSMVLTYRRHYQAWMFRLAFASIPLTLAAGLILYLTSDVLGQTSSQRHSIESLACSLMLYGWLLCPALIVLRRALARMVDLNDLRRDVSRLVADAPKATLLSKEGSAKVAPLPAPAATGWARHQLLKPEFPAVCCGCAEPSQETTQVYITQHARLPIPLCSGCRSRFLRKWAIISCLIAAIPSAWCVAFYAKYSLSARDDGWAGLLAPALPLLVSLAGSIYLAYRLALPIRYRRFHSHDNTVDVYVRNPLHPTRSGTC